jgi:beta-glucosidase
MKQFSMMLLFLAGWIMAVAQPYKNPDLSVDERVDDLIRRMTPEEKFWQLFMIPGDLGDEKEKFKNGIFGFQVNTAGQNANAAGQMLNYAETCGALESAEKINGLQQFFMEETRLGIPIIPFDEALHGLVRQDATAFPQAIALAATWDIELMHRVADAIASECRSRGIRQVLTPVVNIASDVRWGRTEETYGEDPFLVSEMAVAFVSAFEKAGIITTPKHFVANVGDGGRDSYPIHLNERLMREIHFPPFEACFKCGGSRSVMTSYNSYNGTPCTANHWLLIQLLKSQWGFGGFVISDAGGTGGANVLHFTAADYPDAAVKSLLGGLDVIFQTSYDHHTLFIQPFLDGTIDEAVIDQAVSRVLKVKFELGLFENPYIDPAGAARLNGHPEHRELAKQAARASTVLLKNKNHTLPLSCDIRSIAVIGPDADEVRLGGYSGPGNQKVSVLEGIQKVAGSGITVNYSPGCSRQTIAFAAIPAGVLSHEAEGKRVKGLKGEYFGNIQFQGTPAFTRVDEKIQFQWTLFSPDPQKLDYDFYSVRWSGKLTAPESGTFKIGIDGNDGYRIYLDGDLILDNWVKRTKQAVLTDFYFEKGREYDLLIEYYEPTGNAWFSLVWDVGIVDEQPEGIELAVAMAQKSDVAVVVAGIEEGEFQDRAFLGLPGRQEELINKIAATGKPVVVVLIGGSSITMNNWMENAGAILHAWYPGEEGGNAVAEILFGDINPAGRLPVTFPVFEGQLPLVYNHKPTGRGDDYMNLTGQPLFPFGFGLSYTNFEYSDLHLEHDQIGRDDSTRVSIRITNTGEMAGDEVVQLYLRDELASVARPVTELKGFERIFLHPGESRIISFLIHPEILSMVNAEMIKVVEPGDFRIMIGASSKDIRQRIILTVRE